MLQPITILAKVRVSNNLPKESVQVVKDKIGLKLFFFLHQHEVTQNMFQS